VSGASSRTVTVRAPATSANLGPGFDALGLALELCDEIEVTAEFGGLQQPVVVDVEGPGASGVPRDEGHLVVRAMRAAFAELGEQPSALRLTCRNALPHGRGLGSSAAAIVAGVAAAAELAEPGKLDRQNMLELAARLEGHPDNVAACLLGGLTVAWSNSAGTASATRADVHADVTPVVCIPPEAVSTETARGLLPATVSHQDAAINAARAALLVQALTRQPELLLVATEDRLHQAYREPAMPQTIALIERLRADGLAAVVSGAGPSVLVLGAAVDVGQVRSHAPDWDVRALPVRRTGVAVLRTA